MRSLHTRGWDESGEMDSLVLEGMYGARASLSGGLLMSEILATFESTVELSGLEIDPKSWPSR